MGGATDEASELVRRIGAAANMARNDAVLKARCILYMAAGALMMAQGEADADRRPRGYTGFADLCWQMARELDGMPAAQRGVAPWPGRESEDISESAESPAKGGASDGQ